MLARSVIKWNRACGKVLARLISYIHQAKHCRQHCLVADKISGSVGDDGQMYDSPERTTRPHKKQHTNKGWRSDLTPSWASGHTRGSRRDIQSAQVPSSHSTHTAVQETNRRVSQLCDSEIMSLGVDGHTSTATVGLRFRNIFALQCLEKTLTSTSGKRHSLFHSTGHMSVDMVDHVPSNSLVSSCPAKLYTCEENEAVIRMTKNKVAVPI